VQATPTQSPQDIHGTVDTSGSTTKTWIHPADPTYNISPEGGEAFNPQVAMDDSGNAIIVWSNAYIIFKSGNRRVNHDQETTYKKER